MQHEKYPEQSQQHELIEKKVWNHGKVPSLGGEIGGFYLILGPRELSAAYRYTTLSNANSRQAIHPESDGLFLLPHLFEERDGPSTPLCHAKAVEFFIPDVHARQRIQRNHRDLTRQDVLIL